MSGSNIGAVLKSYVERVERLAEEKKTISEDMTEVFKEAKGHGLDTKTMRKLIALRKKDRAEAEAEKEMLDTYLAAMGMEWLA